MKLARKQFKQRCRPCCEPFSFEDYIDEEIDGVSVGGKKYGCSDYDLKRKTRLPCRCYPITVPGRFFSLLCCQSRAYESFQSPRPPSLRSRAYGYPKLDTGTR